MIIEAVRVELLLDRPTVDSEAGLLVGRLFRAIPTYSTSQPVIDFTPTFIGWRIADPV